MEIRTLHGNKIENLTPCAYCMKANKHINELEHCPLYNFDDEGFYCVPAKCDHYTEEKKSARLIDANAAKNALEGHKYYMPSPTNAILNKVTRKEEGDAVDQ